MPAEQTPNFGMYLEHGFDYEVQRVELEQAVGNESRKMRPAINIYNDSANRHIERVSALMKL